MSDAPKDIEALIEIMARLPGLGPRSARRAVLHLIKKRGALMRPLAQTMSQVAETARECLNCGNIGTGDLCPICTDDKRANMRELQVTFAPGSSNNSIVIKVYQDGTLSSTATLTDSSRRMRLAGDCRKFYIVGENDTNNSTFSVSNIMVRYKPGNMR